MSADQQFISYGDVPAKRGQLGPPRCEALVDGPLTMSLPCSRWARWLRRREGLADAWFCTQHAKIVGMRGQEQERP